VSPGRSKEIIPPKKFFRILSAFNCKKPPGILSSGAYLPIGAFNNLTGSSSIFLPGLSITYIQIKVPNVNRPFHLPAKPDTTASACHLRTLALDYGTSR
jgi:hypothetical protein